MLSPSEMKDRMLDLAKQDGFIDGIFNYCDRWCDRCEFTQLCRNHAFGEEAPPPEGPAFWDYIHNVFEATMLMIKESMVKLEISQEDIDKYTHEDDDPAKHPLYHRAHQLAFTMHAWLEKNKPGPISCEEDEIVVSVPENNNMLSDAIDIIYYYNFFVSAKIYRALLSDDNYGEGIIQNDSNGSAKIALVALDRLIAAWSILMENQSKYEDEILKFLISLAEVRNQAETKFPYARKFIRPGFDR